MLLPHVLLPALSLFLAQVVGDDELPYRDVLHIHRTTVSSLTTGCQKDEQLQVSSRRIFKRQAGGGGLGGCGNQMLSQILQQSVQRATGKSFEVLMGKGDMVVDSYQMNQNAHCRIRVGEYYTTVYETPVQYNINDERREEEMSNIDFGERLGGSGYPGQQPWPYLDPIEYDLIDFHAFLKRLECFSGDLIVETIEGPKRMRDLRTGDRVMSMEDTMISFSPIVMFLHRDEDIVAEFNAITTASGESVKLTNEHLIYVSDCSDLTGTLRLVKAKEVTTEHCLVASRSSEGWLSIDRVVDVTKTYERGIYAPLTLTGDIIVNNLLSSCHSNLAARTLQDSFFSIYRSLSFLLPKDGAIPFGVEFLSSALDLFIPAKAAFS